MLRLLGVLVTSFFATIYARFRRGPALPSWTFQFEWIVTFLRQDFMGSSAWSYADLRRDLNSRHYPARDLKLVTVRRETLGGLPAVWFDPPEAGPGVVLFFHGGSYIFGSIETSHAELAASLALRSRTRVVGVDYPLAPEHPYPAALKSALSAFDALVASGIPESEIIVSGDSAGGNLAVALQLALRDRGDTQARAALLFSPWLELTGSRPSCRSGDRIDYGHSSFLLKHARDFAGDVPLTDPRISPLAADLEGLAPLIILVGGAERLFDEGLEFTTKARAQGVAVEWIVAEDMPHNPPALYSFHPNADAGFSASAECARALLGAREN